MNQGLKPTGRGARFGVVVFAVVALGLLGFSAYYGYSTLNAVRENTQIAREDSGEESPRGRKKVALYEIKQVQIWFRSEDEKQPALKITSPCFHVDLIEVPDLIRSHGGNIQSWDWNRGIWTVEGDMEAHLLKLRPALDKLVKKLRISWCTQL